METTSESTIRAIIATVPGLSAVTSSVEFQPVDAYRIIYRTRDVEGNMIVASGLLLHPDVNSLTSLISYQHGTLTNVDDAPSNFRATSEVVVNLTLSGAGYTVIMPDYIGYGTASDLLHPYEHATSLGQTSFDFLQAAKEFIEIRNIAISDRLFLAGYSEGGYATMALHKHIEEQSNLTVTVSAPAAGAYNKTAFSLDVVNRDEHLNFLSTYLWVLDTYNRIYDINRPWSSLVNSTDAAILNAIADPMDIPSANVSSNPKELFLPGLIAGIQDGTETELLAALADNDIFDWTPRAPVKLYHGSADDFVFPLNSRTAFEAMQQNGADVELIEFEGKDHGTATTDYIISVYLLFESLK